MGSGCNSNCSNLFGQKKADGTIEYTGPAIPALGICTGDSLPEVLAVLLQKIIDYSTGVGISMVNIDLTTCDAFLECLSCCDGCTDLPCLLNCYKNAICEIYDLVKDALIGPYDVKCLTGVTSASKLNEILQALINAHCVLSATVTALQIQVNNIQTQVTNINNNLTTNIGNFLSNALSSCQGSGCVIETGTGASTQIAFRGFVPVGAILPYGGNPAGKFSSTGLGITNTDMCGFALANGNSHTVNGITYSTEDMREQVPVGAGAGVMGGGTLPANAAGSNWNYHQLIGQQGFNLTGGQSGLQAHAHDLQIAPHSHRFRFARKSATYNPNIGGQQYDTIMGYGGDDSYTRYYYEGPVGNPPSYAYIQEDFGVSNTPTGGQTPGEVLPIGDISARDPISVLQPSRALLYIQRLY